jgi:hypothetical protein
VHEALRGETAHGTMLVGSLPLGSVEEVLRVSSTWLGTRLDRLPDGELGPRSDWIAWQYPVFSSRPELDVCASSPGLHRSLPRLRLAEHASASSLEFEHLGYAQAAIASYRTFAALKAAGELPAGCRFQVSLPTPLAPVAAFVVVDHQAAVEPRYERAMLAELDQIVASIPNGDLAIQWDANIEFALLDGLVPAWLEDPQQDIVERLVALGDAVPGEVQLGYHFCHGHDRPHRDRPYHAQRMVEVANAVSGGLRRSLDWLHLPVQGDRVDMRFLERLGALDLQDRTHLYLGVLHLSDGLAGAQARIVAARRFVREFGVATECGWGRHRSSDLVALFELHQRTSSAKLPSTERPQASVDS